MEKQLFVMISDACHGVI